MPKSGYISARVDPELKAEADKVLRGLGLSTTDALNVFLHQVVLHQGLPFDVRMPKGPVKGSQSGPRGAVLLEVARMGSI